MTVARARDSSDVLSLGSPKCQNAFRATPCCQSGGLHIRVRWTSKPHSRVGSNRRSRVLPMRVRFSFPKDSEGFAQHSVVASGSAKRLRRRAPRERLGSRPRSASTSSDLSRRCSRSPLDARPPRRRRRRDRAMSGAPRIPVIIEGCRASAAAPRGFAALVTAPAPRGSSSGPRTGPVSARRHPAAGATIPQGSTPSTARWPTFTARTSA